MLKIIVGNKRYSSWSMRPWLVLKSLGVEFEEQVIGLDLPDTDANIRKFSPAGRVPVLLTGALAIWDSLAICEYLAEVFPDRGLWPHDTAARARARSIVAEMHSGFQALRNECSMKVLEQFPPKQLSADTQKDVARINQLWGDCLIDSKGPFLFGKTFGIADAFYAPVVTRFRTYGIAGNEAYREAVWSSAPLQAWLDDARAETLRAARYE